MSQQTAFRLKPDVQRIFAEVQAKEGENRTIWLHEAVRYWYAAYKAGLTTTYTKNSECYTFKSKASQTKPHFESNAIALNRTSASEQIVGVKT